MVGATKIFNPGQPASSRVILKTFKGVDLTSGAASVDPVRSPEAPNMMPDANGFPVKRPGYWLEYQLKGRINGVYHYRLPEEKERVFIHAGTRLYAVSDDEESEGGGPAVGEQGPGMSEANFGREPMPAIDGGQDRRPVSPEARWTAGAGQGPAAGGESSEAAREQTSPEAGPQVLCQEMNDAPSMAVQLNGALWILDGKTYRKLYRDEAGAFALVPVSGEATVPTITISKGPAKDTAATSYQPINLLTGQRRESFLGTAEDKAYYLSFGGLTSAALTVRVRDGEGNWTQKTEGTDYTVDRENGVVTFAAAPGAPVPVGEDNVTIEYTVPAQENLAKINRCRFGILYGVNGALDRFFLAGNPEEPNLDWWSEYNDPAYIGDVFYSVLGSEASPIMGYSVLNDRLVTHKAEEENDRNAFVRQGELEEDGTALFRIVNVIQGDGAVSERCYGTLSSEPVFLSRRGVFALTANDLTGERYEQKRSFFIDGELKRHDLRRACACVWGRFYVLAAGESLYLLDTDQKSYEGKASGSSFQYECYTWPGITASLVWARGDTLYFGDDEGRVFRFMAADGRSWHYLDWRTGCPAKEEGALACLKGGGDLPQGAAIEAWWCTPLMPLSVYGYSKNILDVWVSAQPYGRSGGDIYYASDQAFERRVKSYKENIFDWNDMDFGDFSFNLLDRPVVIRCGRAVYGVQLFQVKVANTAPRQPFGIYAIQIDYEVAGRVRVV